MDVISTGIFNHGFNRKDELTRSTLFAPSPRNRIDIMP